MMIRKIALLIFVVIIFIGCSSSYTIKKSDELALDEKATIVMKTDDRISVTKTIIKQDTVHAIQFPSGHEFHTQAGEINKIIISNDYGLMYGIAGGVSAILWVILTQDNWNDDNNPGYTIYWSVIFGGLGGSLGYIVGSSQHTYFFESKAKSTEEKGSQ